MVKNPTQLDVPAFYSPLTHDQHAQLGRIAVLWGQADMFVDNLLTALLGLTPEVRGSVFGDRAIGTKLDALSKAAQKLPTGKAKLAVQLFVESAHEVKADRNRCFHGVWGFRITKAQRVEAGAQHHKAPERPFKAKDLPRLERQLCQLSHLGMLALAALDLMHVLEGADPLFHGEPPDQEWFAKWRERHYADHHALGRSWKPGRLPFLDRPLE